MSQQVIILFETVKYVFTKLLCLTRKLKTKKGFEKMLFSIYDH